MIFFPLYSRRLFLLISLAFETPLSITLSLYPRFFKWWRKSPSLCFVVSTVEHIRFILMAWLNGIVNFKRNVKVVLFKRENLIKTIWWLSVTYIACRNHLGSLSYRQLVSMPCGMQLCHLVLHPPWSIDHFPKHRNSLSFGTHQWCFLTSTINDTQACTRKRIFHWEKEEGIFLRLF